MDPQLACENNVPRRLLDQVVVRSNMALKSFFSGGEQHYWNTLPDWEVNGQNAVPNWKWLFHCLLGSTLYDPSVTETLVQTHKHPHTKPGVWLVGTMWQRRPPRTILSLFEMKLGIQTFASIFRGANPFNLIEFDSFSSCYSFSITTTLSRGSSQQVLRAYSTYKFALEIQEDPRFSWLNLSLSVFFSPGESEKTNTKEWRSRHFSSFLYLHWLVGGFQRSKNGKDVWIMEVSSHKSLRGFFDHSELLSLIPKVEMSIVWQRHTLNRRRQACSRKVVLGGFMPFFLQLSSREEYPMIPLHSLRTTKDEGFVRSCSQVRSKVKAQRDQSFQDLIEGSLSLCSLSLSLCFAWCFYPHGKILQKPPPDLTKILEGDSPGQFPISSSSSSFSYLMAVHNTKTKEKESPKSKGGGHKMRI